MKLHIAIYTSFFLIITQLLFTNCSHVVWKTYKVEINDSIETDTIECDVAFVRIHPNDSIAENIGEIVFDDLGLSFFCSEKDVIKYLQNEACRVNAHIVLIKKIKRPNIKSYCFRCIAVLYRLRPDANQIATNKYFEEERIYKRAKKDKKKKIQRTFYILANIARYIDIYNDNVEMYNHKQREKEKNN